MKICKTTPTTMAAPAAPAAAAAAAPAEAASAAAPSKCEKWEKNERKGKEKERFFDSLIRNYINDKSEPFESEINEYFSSEIKFRIFMFILVIYINKAKEIFNYINKQTDRVWVAGTMNCYKISYRKEETNHFNVKLLIQILNIIFGVDYKIFNYKWSDTRFYFETYKEKKYRFTTRKQEKSGYFRIPNDEEATINNLRRNMGCVGKPNRIDLPNWNCAFVTPEGTKIEGKDNIKTHLQTAYNYDPEEHWICIIRKWVWEEIRGKTIWQKSHLINAPVLFRNNKFLTILETKNGKKIMRLKGEVMQPSSPSPPRTERRQDGTVGWATSRHNPPAGHVCEKRVHRKRRINFIDAPINFKSLHSNTSSQKKSESRKHEELIRKAVVFTETTNQLKKEQKEFEEKQRSETWEFEHKQRIEKKEFFKKQWEEQKIFSTKQALGKSELEEKVKKLNDGESKDGESKDGELSPNDILDVFF